MSVHDPTSAVSVSPGGESYPLPSAEQLRDEFGELSEKISWQRALGRQVVVIQGLGYVGTANAAVIASARRDSGDPCFFVICVDLANDDAYWKIGELNQGRMPIDSDDAELSAVIKDAVDDTRNLCATSCAEVYSEADVIVVNLSLQSQRAVGGTIADIELDMQPFETAMRTVGKRMRADALVLVETTGPVGTCEKIVAPLLRHERDMRATKTPLLLTHLCESVAPGPGSSVRHNWRSFAGISKESNDRTQAFLKDVGGDPKKRPMPMSQPAASEMAKLFENSLRTTSIAFIHEWTRFAERVGINFFEVIDALQGRRGRQAARSPTFGVGGYRLTKDPLLAQWALANLYDSELVLDFTLNALRINDRMPLHALSLLMQVAQNDLRGGPVVICGLSHVPDLADTRNTPTERLVDALLKEGAHVIVHDPIVTRWPERPEIQLTNNFGNAVFASRAIVFAVPHQFYAELSAEQLRGTSTQPPVLVDAQNIIDDSKAAELYQQGCRIIGIGKGHWRRCRYHTDPEPALLDDKGDDDEAT